jgi:hypothetical protein
LVQAAQVLDIIPVLVQAGLAVLVHIVVLLGAMVQTLIIHIQAAQAELDQAAK